MRCTTCGGQSERETCDACLGFVESRRRAKLEWLYTCAHRALKLARVYKKEDGATSVRARGCVAQVKVYRRDIRAIRSNPVLSLPGIMKTRAPQQHAAQKSRAS